jgi:hypothetical protein
MKPPPPSPRPTLPPLPPPPSLPFFFRYLVIDLAFVIEGREDGELPEVCLGTVRLSRMDVSKPTIVKPDPSDWKLGTEQPFGES